MPLLYFFAAGLVEAGTSIKRFDIHDGYYDGLPVKPNNGSFHDRNVKSRTGALQGLDRVIPQRTGKEDSG